MITTVSFVTDPNFPKFLTTWRKYSLSLIQGWRQALKEILWFCQINSCSLFCFTFVIFVQDVLMFTSIWAGILWSPGLYSPSQFLQESSWCPHLPPSPPPCWAFHLFREVKWWGIFHFFLSTFPEQDFSCLPTFLLPEEHFIFFCQLFLTKIFLASLQTPPE